MALAYLTMSVLQGGADAFAIDSVQTALAGQTQRAFRVREIITEIPRVQTAAAGNIEIAICRRTKAAMPNITDRDVILKRKVGTEITTSGAICVPALVDRQAYSEDDELLIVEEEIFICVDSNAFSLTQTVYARIGYELVNISAVDRLTLLTQSLSS